MKSPPTANPPPSSISPPAPARNPLASLQSAKRKRLPQDKVGQLEDRIALDARDADAWLGLIQEYQAKGKISDARNTYERFFKVFPDLVDNISFY
jgi:cleavage stimulation factor subunit 3